MTLTPTHAPGTFCWVDLAAHDAGAARAFYTALFGWTAADSQYGPAEGDVYTMYTLDGSSVGASYAMDASQKAMGIPSSWMSYVAVESADAGAERAKELGGSVVAEPFDVMQAGRMALVQDPTGAVFALWEARSHPGVGVRDVPGALAWNELATNDAPKARDFYTGLFGWRAEAMDGPIEYTILHAAAERAGGLFQLTPEMGEMPPCWLPYFGVESADAAADKAASLGATVLMGPDDIPDVGRFALVRDPQGALFYLFHPLAM